MNRESSGACCGLFGVDGSPAQHERKKFEESQVCRTTILLSFQAIESTHVGLSHRSAAAEPAPGTPAAAATTTATAEPEHSAAPTTSTTEWTGH